MVNILTPASHNYGIDNTISSPPNLSVNDKISNTIDKAEHLDINTKENTKKLFNDLIKEKSITINDFNANRDLAVAGIQYGMESVLAGTEYIITPTLPTPFKNPFNKMQMARKEILEKRLETKKVHLFFYKIDKENTEYTEQYNKYKQTTFLKHGENDNPTLFEHQLDLDNEMLANFSGAIILNPDGDSFIIEACQAKQANDGNSKNNLQIKLFYDEIDNIINSNKIPNLKKYLKFIHDKD